MERNTILRLRRKARYLYGKIMSSKEFENIYKTIRNEYPVLPDEEVKTLIRKYRETGDVNFKHKIVLSNAGLVMQACRQWKLNSLDIEDLFNEGIMGVDIAVDKFDLSMETTFTTYAYYWITQKISRYVKNTESIIRLPIHVSDQVYHAYCYSREFEEKNHRPPTREEIKKEFGYSEQVLDYIFYNLNHTASLNLEVGNEKDSQLMDFVADDTDMEKKVIDSIESMELHKIIKERLSKREYDIINMRYGLDGNTTMTLREIGDYYGLSRERIRQIEEKAMRKLRISRELRNLRKAH